LWGNIAPYALCFLVSFRLSFHETFGKVCYRNIDQSFGYVETAPFISVIDKVLQKEWKATDIGAK
jgi:hypothetical protein